MYVYCYFSVLSINLTSFFMLETSIYVCPNLSSCVRTCAAGHSWDDRHAHLQELRGEAPPWWRKRPEEGPRAGGRGARQLPQQWMFLKILGRSCDLRFIFFLNATSFPVHSETWSSFSKSVSLCVRESVIHVWPNRLSGILAP